MWARLFDGEKVGENVTALLSNSTSINMFDMHPPFQIDGNFGGGAGIAEALLQSHSGEICFIPALPKEWESGSVKGMKARGGFEVSFSWAGGKMQTAKIKSLCGNSCTVYSDAPIEIYKDGKPVPNVVFQKDNNTYTFISEIGDCYEIKYC